MASCCMAEAWTAVPEWIAKAEGDWEALEILLTRNTPGLRDAVVFHAQQCVEKLLKARLIQLGQAVDKIHDLPTLSRQLEAVTDPAAHDPKIRRLCTPKRPLHSGACPLSSRIRSSVVSAIAQRRGCCSGSPSETAWG